MPRTPEQNEQIREQRRREILEAATALFVENGFAATSVSAIAKAAGVSHGTVFLYYPTKEDLFRATLVEPLADFEADFLRSVRQTTGTPLRRLQALTEYHVHQVAAQERYLRLAHYVLGQRDQFRELTDNLARFSHTVIHTLAPIIREGQEQGALAPGDPYWIAASWYAFVQGAVLVFATPPDDEASWNQAIQGAMRLLGPLKPITPGSTD